MKILPNEEDKIRDILTDSKARKRVKKHIDKIKSTGNKFLKDMKPYGLDAICITSSAVLILQKTDPSPLNT